MEITQVPSSGKLVRESLGLLQLPRLALHFPWLLSLPKGEGRPVMIFPGFGTSDRVTWPLRSFLGLLGYRVRGWDMGVNKGNVPKLIPRVVERTVAAANEEGHRISLLGWSLGGYLAREVARDKPQYVQQVITLGTPVVGGPKYTTAASHYRRRGFDLDAIEAYVEERNKTPIQVPVLAIYSRSDNVVVWQACVDESSPQVEHFEIPSTHIGLGIDPDVYRVIARRLVNGGNRTQAADVG